MILSDYKNLFTSLVIAFLAYFVSSIIFNEVESKLIGVITFLITLWINEALPLGVVSLLPIILFPIFGILEPKSVVVNYSKTIEPLVNSNITNSLVYSHSNF